MSIRFNLALNYSEQLYPRGKAEQLYPRARPVQRIELISLPSKCSHAMQPCDVGRFAPIEKHFRKHLQITVDKRPGIQPHRSEYATLISTAAVETGTRKAIRNSFKATGIWPIDEMV
jgi:hypothetical protein